MAYYAAIDENNVVQQVIKVNNEVITDENGVEDHAKGIAFLKNLPGNADKNFLRTSFGTYANVHYHVDPETNEMTVSDDQSKAFRKNYAGAGSIYHPDLDGFSHPQPFPSWILDEETCVWHAPIAKPDTENSYSWDEDAYQADNTQGWVLNT